MTQLFMTLPDIRAVPPVVAPASELLRAATAADAPALASVLSAAFDEPWNEERVRRDLLEADDVAATWLLVDDADRVLGTASERIMSEYPGAGYVHWVGVDPRFAGRGLGTALTRAVLDGFLGRGVGAAVLETDDFRIPAVVTYLRLGFVPSLRTAAEAAAWSALLPRLFGARR